MEAMRRELVWVERQDFWGWGCSKCVRVFNTAGPPIGDSIDETVTTNSGATRSSHLMSAPNTRESRTPNVKSFRRVTQIATLKPNARL
jgi:hypothetical protein